MRLRAGVLASLAALGIALLGLWLFAQTVLIEVQRMLDRETLEALVRRARLRGPIMIVGP